MTKYFFFVLAIGSIMLNCQAKQQPVVEFAHYPITNVNEILTKSDVVIDTTITSDGNGSLLITALEPMTVRLFEIEDPDIENARIVYSAKMRCENLEGSAYLEILCGFLGKGEFFGKGLPTAVSGTTDWSSAETYFFFRKGENPNRIKLNLVIDGKGKVWIDDVHLTKGPLML